MAAQVSSFADVSSFEVASVKPSNPPAGPHVVSLIFNHGTLNIEAAELWQIVSLAYAIQRVRVLGDQDGPIPSNSILPQMPKAQTRRSDANRTVGSSLPQPTNSPDEAIYL